MPKILTTYPKQRSYANAASAALELLVSGRPGIVREPLNAGDDASQEFVRKFRKLALGATAEFDVPRHRRRPLRFMSLTKSFRGRVLSLRRDSRTIRS